MAIEIPPGFGRDVERFGQRPGARQAGADRRLDRRRHAAARRDDPGLRAGHAPPLAPGCRPALGCATLGVGRHWSPATVELRYRYNPDVKSLVAMVPAVIPLLLLLIPAMLATLSVVREKDLGSIINFYVTPTTRLEFLLGKQLPYVVLGCINFLLLAALAVTLFRVPLKGDFVTAAAGALLYVGCSTGIGLFVSTLTRTQVAALFATAVLTLIPAGNFCGLTDPVSSLEGFGRLVGDDLPDQLLHHDFPRDLQQGAGFCRPVRLVPPPADRDPGARSG